MAGAADADTVVYRLSVDVTWSEETHPGLFPQDAHLSWHGGATHVEQVSFWEVGELASPGMVQMAELGATLTLMDEVQERIDSGVAWSKLDWPWWFCPSGTSHPQCSDLEVEFPANDAFPFVTLVSMLGPSPDWFVGVSGLPLRANGEWLKQVVIDLHPYDGGTRDANVFELFGPLTTPPAPVSVITERTGQIITPASLGTYTFTLLTAPCPADVDQSGEVDGADLAQLLGNWGAAGPGDVDGDGTVTGADLAQVLGSWGTCG